jgi:hypothetical protein
MVGLVNNKLQYFLWLYVGMKYKDRTLRFSKEWENTTNEEADAKPFLDAFFDVFGITRKKQEPSNIE